jgi:medium-chain acyl-[acyl-carrier-protein] hydrolase
MVPEGIDIIGIQAPGKGARVLEAPYIDLSALVEDLLAAMMPSFGNDEFSFFGHSNGAMIAFHLACRLQALRLPLPHQLFLSDNPAPWSRTGEKNYATMPDDEFKSKLRELNATPSEILQDDELLKLLMPGLRADFMLADSYRFPRGLPLPVKTTIFHAKQGEIPLHQILAWEERIAGPVAYHEMPGGHFFLHTHEQLLVDDVSRRLRENHDSRSERIIA